jgi:hypothetical protein
MWFFLFSAAFAHDSWLQAEPPARADPGKVVLNLALGEGFVVEELRPYAAARTVSFFRRGPDGDVALQAQDGAIPAWQGDLPVPGGYLFALERKPASLELEPAKFDAYLESEGLGQALAERRAAGEGSLPGRETYVRFLKAWVPVGPGPFLAPFDPVGHRLEFTLVDPPMAGTSLRVALAWEGAPLADHPVTAHVRRAERPEQVETTTVRTDQAGNATFALAAEGRWLLRTVFMERCRGCEGADWSSAWTSFSFPVYKPAPPVSSECGCRS